MRDYAIVVIGGGPAGMAAALSAKENGINDVLLVERSETLGGILNQCIHTGFGLVYFGEELTGREYADRIRKKIDASGIDVLTGTAVIGLHPDGTVEVSGDICRLQRIKTGAVILATGCRERPVGALPVTGTRPSGIFAAGMAQKMVNLGGYDIGSRFVILGSGDVGMIMARQLKLLGKDVIAVIEKEEACGGLVRNRINCLERYHIPLRTRCTVSEIHGSGRISGVTVLDLSDSRKEFVACDTLITSVGLIPERELLEEAAAAGGALPDWLFLCGNACYVHDTVDDVSAEAEHIGREAALFVREGCRSDILLNPAKEKDNDFAAAVCIACPKGCRLTKTNNGWAGALCGRKDPMPSKMS